MEETEDEEEIIEEIRPRENDISSQDKNAEIINLTVYEHKKDKTCDHINRNKWNKAEIVIGYCSYMREHIQISWTFTR